MKPLTLGTVNAGYEIVSATQFPNPKDDYLFTVLGFNSEATKYVVWTYNNQDGGFFWGHYFRNRDEAYQYYMEACANKLKSYFGSSFLAA